MLSIQMVPVVLASKADIKMPSKISLTTVPRICRIIDECRQTESTEVDYAARVSVGCKKYLRRLDVPSSYKEVKTFNFSQHSITVSKPVCKAT